jgi:NADPH-dependent 2,4-dienoyl-CoA reductase/sulfur reductase-like enzyme/nitrite reductase/ring-hydroxylating ferredoxin subunit
MSHTDARVARADELKDGEMKEVTVGETKILLARVGDRYHALNAHCTHYGAPLAKGVLSQGRIVCPWHHACFAAATGDMLEPPALDSLVSFPVRIDDGNLVVILPDEPTDRRTPSMSKRDAGVDDLYVILGAGAAGYMAAQTLREDGYTGRIVMITREGRLPYDRPNLSKDYLHGHADPEWMPLRGEEFFADNGIEVMLNREVKRVDTAARTIMFDDGSSQSYDKLLVATGGTPRRLPVPGADLKNIFLLRSFDDADSIIKAAGEASRAVVVGASFIGMEAAFSLRKRGLHVTVVAPESIPFEKILGPEIGSLYRKLHEENGVEFRLGASVARLEGTGKFEAVVLESGERIEADMLITGLGFKPATEILDGLRLGKDGGVVVDSYLSAADRVYAAGDIAAFIAVPTGARVRIEHGRTALQQGRVAARNMMGKQEEFNRVPFFWTEQFDTSLRYVGHAEKWDEIIYQGDVSARQFLAFYVQGERVVAIAGMKRDRDMAALEELMRLDRMPAPGELRNGTNNFSERLRP